jgi:hypothetical protein
MKVTIVGGWSPEPDDNRKWELDVADRTTIIAACEAIGKRLAKKRHTIVVGNDKENSADRYVVRGFLSQLENRAAPDGLIQVIERIQGEETLYREQRKSEKHQNIFIGKDSSFSGAKTARRGENLGDQGRRCPDRDWRSRRHLRRRDRRDAGQETGYTLCIFRRRLSPLVARNADAGPKALDQ